MKGYQQSKVIQPRSLSQLSPHVGRCCDLPRTQSVDHGNLVRKNCQQALFGAIAEMLNVRKTVHRIITTN